jgi:hypothetical protein
MSMRAWMLRQRHRMVVAWVVVATRKPATIAPPCRHAQRPARCPPKRPGALLPSPGQASRPDAWQRHARGGAATLVNPSWPPAHSIPPNCPRGRPAAPTCPRLWARSIPMIAGPMLRQPPCRLSPAPYTAPAPPMSAPVTGRRRCTGAGHFPAPRFSGTPSGLQWPLPQLPPADRGQEWTQRAPSWAYVPPSRQPSLPPSFAVTSRPRRGPGADSLTPVSRRHVPALPPSAESVTCAAPHKLPPMQQHHPVAPCQGASMEHVSTGSIVAYGQIETQHSRRARPVDRRMHGKAGQGDNARRSWTG